MILLAAVAASPVHVARLRPSLSPRLHRTPPSAAMAVASAKRRRSRRRPSPAEDDAAAAPVEEETQDVGSAELEFLAALKSESTPATEEREAPISRPPQPPQASSSDSVRRAPLRGLDVLQALQRKAEASKKGGTGAGKGGRGQRLGAKGSGGGGEGQLGVRDYSNVRPLDIKSDWGPRLDELDRLISELQTQQHHYSD